MKTTKGRYLKVAEIERLTRLVELLREKQDRLRLALYKPHEGQKSFHEHPAQIRVITSGNRWGKTTAIVTEALSFCLGNRAWEGEGSPFYETRETPSKVLLLCQDFSNILEQTILPKLFQFLPSDALLPGRQGIRIVHSNIPVAFHFKNGSMLKIGSFEQDTQKLEGGDWDLIVIDEEIPRDHYIAARRGIIDRKGRIIMAVTSVTPQSAWMYDDLYLRQDGKRIQFFGGRSYENPYVPHEEVQEFEYSLTPEERIARIEGGFMQWAGRVYPEFDTKVHVFDFNQWFNTPDRRREFDSYPKGLCIDPHDRKPIAMAWFAVTPTDDLLFFREWPEEDFLNYRKPNSIESYAELIRNAEKNMQRAGTWRIIDPNFGRQRKLGMSGDSVEDQFAQFRLHFDSRVDNDIPTGHLTVKRRLLYDTKQPISQINKPKIYVEQSCKNIIRAFLQYTWSKRKQEDRKGLTERPEEKYKDFADVVRYTCMFDPHYFDPISDLKNRQRGMDRLKKAYVR